MTDPDADRLLQAVDALRVWQRGGQRAPHKPLLVLLMLGRLRHADQRLVAFTDIEDERGRRALRCQARLCLPWNEARVRRTLSAAPRARAGVWPVG